MKKNILNALIVLLFALMICSDVSANSKQTGALFLNLPAGAASTGMGEAYSSIAKGVSAVFWNPAGLSDNTEQEIMFMHNSYISDVNQEYLAYCKYIKVLGGTLGADINFMDYGSFDKTMIMTSTTYSNAGSFSAKDYAISLAYSRKNDQAFKFGAAIKYLKSKIDSSKTSSFALDIGTLYEFDAADYPLNLAFTVRNLGTDIKFDTYKEKLPLTFKTGISAELKINENFTIYPSIDNVFTKYEDYYVSIGTEVKFQNAYFLRVGYNSLYDAGSGLSFGLGAQIGKAKVDYAFINYGDLKNSHRFSVNYKFSVSK